MPASDTRSDAAVIRASGTDPAAFAAIFDRHWVRIHRYCVVRAGPPGEDLAAETFRIAFDGRGRYDGRPDAAPWLYGIATNLLRRWFRSSARGTRAVARTAGHATTGPGTAGELEDALDRLEAERLGPELAAGLATLGTAERDALLLHAIAELTYDEVAVATGAPPGTVRSRIHRARHRVRAHLNALELSR